MKMKTILSVIAIAVLVATGAQAGQLEAAGAIKVADNVFAIPGAPTNLNITDLHSGNLPGECDAIGQTNFCCEFLGDPTCDDAPGNYNGGDLACFSDYWVEEVTADADWTVDWSHAYILPGGAVPIFLNEPIDYGFLAAGTYTFCVGYTIELPTPPFAATVDTGFLVTSPDESAGPEITGSFTLNP